jgi:hypothetical protein
MKIKKWWWGINAFPKTWGEIDKQRLAIKYIWVLV